MMSLMPTAMPAQRPGALRADVRVVADEGADGLFMRTDCFTRLRDRGVGGKIAGIDAALEVGERDHEGTSCDDEAGYGVPRHRSKRNTR